MAGRDEGRYYAEEIELDTGASIRGQLQEVLDQGAHKDWHLVGVSDLPDNSVILFWDTIRPNYGRSQYES